MLDMDVYYIIQVVGKVYILIMFKSFYLLVINIYKIVVEISILYRFIFYLDFIIDQFINVKFLESNFCDNVRVVIIVNYVYQY